MHDTHVKLTHDWIAFDAIKLYFTYYHTDTSLWKDIFNARKSSLISLQSFTTKKSDYHAIKYIDWFKSVQKQKDYQLILGSKF